MVMMLILEFSSCTVASYALSNTRESSSFQKMTILTINSALAVSSDGRISVMKTVPIISEGRICLPIRFIFEEILEGKVDFSNGDIDANAYGNSIKMAIGSNTALVNGTPIDLLTAPFVEINSNCTLAPMRELLETIGVKIDYKAKTNQVVITFSESNVLRTQDSQVIALSANIGKGNLDEGLTTFESIDIHEKENQEKSEYEIYTFQNGDKYQGEMVNGKFHGFGRMDWASGGWYEGDWVNGEMSGYGLLLTALGDTYEGDFFNGACRGQVKITYDNGDTYEGGFADGKFHGSGNHRTASSGIIRTYSGEAMLDGFYGYFTQTGPSLNGYYGMMERDNLNGRGTFVLVHEGALYPFDGHAENGVFYAERTNSLGWVILHDTGINHLLYVIWPPSDVEDVITIDEDDWTDDVEEIDEIEHDIFESAGAFNQVTIETFSMAGGRVTGGGTYSINSSVTLIAEPEGDWLFGGWFENDKLLSTDLSLRFSANQSRFIEVLFTPYVQTSLYYHYYQYENSVDSSVLYSFNAMTSIEGNSLSSQSAQWNRAGSSVWASAPSSVGDYIFSHWEMKKMNGFWVFPSVDRAGDRVFGSTHLQLDLSDQIGVFQTPFIELSMPQYDVFLHAIYEKR